MKNTFVLAVALGAALAGAPLAPAVAHHSYVLFDRSRLLRVEGTIARLEWSNPHCFVWLYAPKAGGGYTLYGFEGGGTANLAGLGWKKDSLKAGEEVAVAYYPLRDGRPGGAFASFTHADGTVNKGDLPGGVTGAPSPPPTGTPAPGGSQ